MSWMTAHSRRHSACYFWSGAQRFWRSFRLSVRCFRKTKNAPEDTQGTVNDANRQIFAHQRTQSGQDRDINGTLNDAKRTLMGRTPLWFG